MSSGECVVGAFVERAVPETATHVSVELHPFQLRTQWKRCGLTADWLSAYLAHDLQPSTRETAQNVLSTVFNELIENAVKFCADERALVSIAACHHDALLRIETRNVAPDTHAKNLRRTLDELDRASSDSLFAKRIAGGGAAESAGIGLIIVKRDYGARIGARLTPRGGANTVDVHLRVELDASRIARE